MKINFFTNYLSSSNLTTHQNNSNSLVEKNELKPYAPISPPQTPPPKMDDKSSITTTIDSATPDQLKILESVIEDFTGKDVEIIDVKEFHSMFNEEIFFKQDIVGKTNFKGMHQFHYKNSYREIESLKLDTELTIVTNDGEEFNIDLELDFSQEFLHKTNYKSKNFSDFQPVFLKSSTKDILKTKLDFNLEITPIIQTEDHEDENSAEEMVVKPTPLSAMENSDIHSDGVTQDNLVSNKENNTSEEKQVEESKNPLQGNFQQALFESKYLDFIKIFSKKGDEKQTLVAIGLLTEQKIFLSSVLPTQPTEKEEPATTTNI